MPNFPIIDAHVHLWNPQHFRMSWLDGTPLLNQPYELPEYREHTGTIAIEAMVYLEVDVEAPYKLLEAQWAAEKAKQEPRLQGIVAAAPVEYGERVRAYLEALRAIDPKIKGVRRMTQGEADPDFCLQPDFIRGVQLLPEYGLSFDICIHHTQLASTIKLVQQCPDTAFMLDHIANPNIKEYVLDPWRAHMRTMASYPNVTCKVSGMATNAGHWSPADLAPYLVHVLDVFGEDRVAFGGDWPVVLLASSYERWVETLDTLTTHLSQEAKRKLWAENARTFYRLGS